MVRFSIAMEDMNRLLGAAQYAKEAVEGDDGMEGDAAGLDQSQTLRPTF